MNDEQTMDIEEAYLEAKVQLLVDFIYAELHGTTFPGNTVVTDYEGETVVHYVKINSTFKQQIIEKTIERLKKNAWSDIVSVSKGFGTYLALISENNNVPYVESKTPEERRRMIEFVFNLIPKDYVEPIPSIVRQHTERYMFGLIKMTVTIEDRDVMSRETHYKQKVEVSVLGVKIFLYTVMSTSKDCAVNGRDIY